MKSRKSAPREATEDEVASLISTLLRTEQRLEELTGGEVDTVASQSGQPFLLRRAQEQLRRSKEAKQEAILNALPAHIAMLDAQGIIISVNEAWRRFGRDNLSVAPGHGLGLNYLDICDRSRGQFADEAHQVAAGIRAVLEGTEPNFSIEYPCHSPGEHRWFLLMVTPVAGHQMHGAVVMHLNITERRQAVQALRLSEERFAGAFAHAPIGMAVVDPTGQWLKVNQALCELVGYTEAEMLSRTFQSMTHPEDLTADLECVRRMLAGEIPTYQLEKRYLHRLGHPVSVLLNVSLVRDDLNRPLYFISQIQDISERKRAEEALCQIQDLLTMASSLTRMGAWSVQLPDFALTLSDGARLIHEMPPGFNPTVEEAMNFYAPEDRPTMARVFAECVRDGTPIDVELQIITTTGRRIWVRSIGKAERDASGVIQRVRGSIQDITQPKLAQLALRASEEEFRSLAESMPQIVWVTRPDGWNIFFNQQWMDYTGLSREESLGHGWNKPFHPDDQQRAMQTWQHATATSGEYSLECRLRRADGVYHWWLIRGVPIRDAAGTILKWIGTCTDIQEMKLADLALRESEQRFKALFEQAAVGVAQADATTGRFLQVNQRFADIVGRNRDELALTTFTSITHPHDLARDSELMQQLKAGAIREFTREKRYLRPEGAEAWVNLTVSAMWEPGDAPGLCIAIVQDITARKQLDLHLLQAQKMEALGQFSGGVAHDFNNILAAISGYTELARIQLQGNPAVREHLGAVMKAANRAADLVRQILTFSRQQPQTRVVMLLQPVVVESMKLMRATIPSTVEIVALIAADAPTVLANANQIHQVLMNLAINGWHALKSHPGRLQVQLEKVAVDAAYAAAKPGLRPGTYARLSVSDTGCGMDQATLRRIFEPFFTTKPPGEGTGLGLSVVHGIMESHDGAVTVNSQPGEGTSFRLYFPEHTGDVATGRRETEPTPRGHGESVLVVDDEEMIAELAANLLNRLGYSAVGTTTSAQALAMVHAEPSRYSLVLTDQTMPSITGLQLASQIRDIRPDLPILLMSGYSLSLTMERVAASGIRNILHKPFTLHSLGAAVHATLHDTTYTPNGTNSPY